MKIALIGTGLYGRSCYVSFFIRHPDSEGQLAVCVDLPQQQGVINEYFTNFGSNPRPDLVYANPSATEAEIRNFVKSLKEKYQLTGVILSTPPEDRLPYIKACLAEKLWILADKPLTAPRDISVNSKKCEDFLRDYFEICDLYERSDKLPFDIMVQRRYHPVFDYMLEKLIEVANHTGTGLTHFQGTHADGQWRGPQEIIDFDYHGANQGQGKISHSGYHFFDIASIFTERSQRAAGKGVTSVGAFTVPTFPIDVLTSVGTDTYQRFFPKYIGVDREKYRQKTRNFGEIDAISTLDYRWNGDSVTSGNLNLLHNSFSGRHWFDANTDDLYRNNGRLRQELHYFVQGPFQSITMVSLRGCSKVPVSLRVEPDGDREPLEIHIFRNKGINNAWKAYEKVTIGDLIPDLRIPDAHLQYARDACIKSWMKGENKSNLLSHKLSAISMYVALQSMISKNFCSTAV